MRSAVPIWEDRLDVHGKGARDPNRPDDAEAPHDVLAAEEFGVGAAAAGLHAQAPHDVLAAEEFGVGAAAAGLHAQAPHDVLAAEEFGVGSGVSELHETSEAQRRWRPAPGAAAALAAATLLAGWLVRRRCRRAGRPTARATGSRAVSAGPGDRS